MIRGAACERWCCGGGVAWCWSCSLSSVLAPATSTHSQSALISHAQPVRCSSSRRTLALNAACHRRWPPCQQVLFLPPKLYWYSHGSFSRSAAISSTVRASVRWRAGRVFSLCTRSAVKSRPHHPPHPPHTSHTLPDLTLTSPGLSRPHLAHPCLAPLHASPHTVHAVHTALLPITPPHMVSTRVAFSAAHVAPPCIHRRTYPVRRRESLRSTRSTSRRWGGVARRRRWKRSSRVK